MSVQIKGDTDHAQPLCDLWQGSFLWPQCEPLAPQDEPSLASQYSESAHDSERVSAHRPGVHSLHSHGAQARDFVAADPGHSGSPNCARNDLGYVMVVASACPSECRGFPEPLEIQLYLTVLKDRRSGHQDIGARTHQARRSLGMDATIDL